MKKNILFFILSQSLLLSSCSTLADLAKSENTDDRKKSPSFFSSLFDESDKNKEQEPNQRKKNDKFNQQKNYLRSTLFQLTKINDTTYRSALPSQLVFNMIARQLSKNYILSAVDRKSLTATTDWDKFFIDSRLFRNRMSVIVFPVANRMTEVVIKNNVEYFSGTSIDSNENGNWLPSPDLTDEVQKLVNSTNRQASQFAMAQ